MNRSRYLASALIGLVMAALLVVAIAVWQFGPSEAKARVVEKLDDWHIVGERTSLLRRANRMERANPDHDVDTAVKAGDKRLLGFSLGLEGPLILPGVKPSMQEEYRKQLGVRVLFVGCVQSAEFERYHKAVARYAEVYNGDLLRVVGQ